MIKLNNISYNKFGKQIIKNVTTNIESNSITSLIGKNGAGKSSLCKILIGALKPSEGELIKPKNCTISYVPQLFDQNMVIPLRVIDFLKLGVKHKLDSTLIEKIGISNLLYSNLRALSGGELQKVLIIRALSRQPDLLILDEAFAFLDFTSQVEVYKIISELQIQQKFAILIISHDMDFVFKNTDCIICLEKGTIHCEGNYKDIKNTDYIKNMIGEYHHKHKKKV